MTQEYFRRDLKGLVNEDGGARTTANSGVAEDAVRREPVSAPNSLLTGKLTGCRIWPSTAIFSSNQRADSIASSRNPSATEQGISKRLSGKIFRGTGEI